VVPQVQHKQLHDFRMVQLACNLKGCFQRWSIPTAFRLRVVLEKEFHAINPVGYHDFVQ
jgi:hypothetical protein